MAKTLRRVVAACCVGLLVTTAPASTAEYVGAPTRHLQATSDAPLDVSSTGNDSNASPSPAILNSGTDITTATSGVPSAPSSDTSPPRRDEASISPEVTTAPPIVPPIAISDTITTPPIIPSTASPVTNTPPPAAPSATSPNTNTAAPAVTSTVSTDTNTAPPASAPVASGESNTVSPSLYAPFTSTDSNTPSPDTTFATFTSDSSTASPASSSISSETRTSSNSSSSSASADDEDRSAETPETSVRSGADTSISAPSPDDQVETGTSYGRGSGLSTEGIIGIAVGGVGLVALVVAFVRVGSSNRRKKSQQSTSDFSSSTGGLNDVRYVDSFDSPAESSTSSATVSANQKPSAPSGSQDVSSSAVDGTAAAADQSSSGATGNESTAHDGEFNPSQTAGAVSKPQRTIEDPESVLSESFVSFAPLNSQSRRSSRHSHVVEDEEGSSPILVQFSRRSVKSNDGDIPMLGRYSSKRRLHSPRDHHIPVLSRGSEESVDSIEDEEIEISI
ncbi:hypothetical protein FI667_g8891, partial [Globisporangium splendens]